jgi:triosephosphate isomerase (TIM)
MSKRVPIVAGNWKMHKTPAESGALVKEIRDGLSSGVLGCEVIVAPPYVSIAAAVEAAAGSPVRVAAQNLFWEEKGAFTGEISGPMLKESGCSHVIVGHSERRQYFGESDETVNRRIAAALQYGLIPIFCLGETLEEREAGKTFEVVETQLKGGIGTIGPEAAAGLVVAYEPVWAIGTGRTATPEQAQEVHGFLREALAGIFGGDFAGGVRILYGGSMKPDNARSLMGQPDIDGGLIGGASLKAADFLGIIREGTK